MSFRNGAYSAGRGSELRRMHELQFQPVRIGKEQRVIALAILRVVGWRIENGGADLDEQFVQSIDVATRVGNPGQMMQAAGIAIMAAIASCQPDADRRRAMPRSHVPVHPRRGPATSTIAEEAQ